MNSYLGIMKHYKTYNFRKRMLFKYLSGWWWNQAYLSGGVAKFVLKTKITRLQIRDKNRSFTNKKKISFIKY